MSLLSRHLEQICLSSESIATLPFPPPRIFTNALLSTPDITSLIRDTEPHERALFSVPPPPPSLAASNPYSYPDQDLAAEKANKPKRRQTVFNVAAGEVTTGTNSSGRAPRRNTAVAAVLGQELHEGVRRAEGKGEMDVEVLLKGVEKLNEVFEVAGATEKVRELRGRYKRIMGSLGMWEERVEKQTRELERLNRGEEWDEDDEDDGEGNAAADAGGGEPEVEVTDEDLRAEEEEIANLEMRKRELDERVKGMERDLGGLLR